MKRIIPLFSTLMAFIMMTGTAAFASTGGAVGNKTDYSNINHWLSFGGDKKNSVDVFVIYPTITQSTDSADRPYVRIDNQMMRLIAAGWLRENAGIFTGSANVYAPLYRQANGIDLDSFAYDTFVPIADKTPREDIFGAFEYYLNHVNKGERPFIIFGHSQGAYLATELATTFLGREKYRRHNENLIAVYAIGFSVLESRLKKNPALKFSREKDDTGVILSWNATAPGEVSSGAYENFGTWKRGALVTNPITWKSDETPAAASQNRASKVIAGDNISFGMVSGYADATVDKQRGLLMVTSVDESKYRSLSPRVGKYHRHDIAFYYSSIRQNIKDRIAAFERK